MAQAHPKALGTRLVMLQPHGVYTPDAETTQTGRGCSEYMRLLHPDHIDLRQPGTAVPGQLYPAKTATSLVDFSTSPMEEVSICTISRTSFESIRRVQHGEVQPREEVIGHASPLI
jgi:hypothetical protein